MKWYLAIALLAVILVGCSRTAPTPQPTAQPTAQPTPAFSSDPANTITTASGLKYEDLEVGTGEEATAGVDVSVHYTGWLENGAKFDSSLDRGRPFEFALGGGRVIKGWDEGVVNMRVGGKRLLTVPTDLAYGDGSPSPQIPPGSTLIFEVELLAIQQPPQPTAQPPAASSTESANTITTASGLQYEDLKVGTGEEARAGVEVSVHYTGWLEDGTKFDSSVDRGQPFNFPLGGGRVIRGWDEGVANMRVGGKRRLTIPADLAYGDRSPSPLIPPGSTLIFEVELLAIK